MYIHQSIYISPQNTYPEIDLETIMPSEDNKLLVKEPSYPGVPTSILRRMGKAVRLGVGSALPLINERKDIDGIIIGTGNGGMEDCIKFLNQVIEYEEGTLTPTNFVQSTTNAIASQLGMMSSNKGHNSTHVHRGLSFENALIDTRMLLSENQRATYLVGGVEEISSYQYNIEYLAGWFKKEPISNADLYHSETEGGLAGEGSAMFLLNNVKENAAGRIIDIEIFESENEEMLKERMISFLEKNKTFTPDLFLSGENGDARFLHYYLLVENELKNIPIARFKHITGEYPSVSSGAVWLACQFLGNTPIPSHLIKSGNPEKVSNILLYNNHKGNQHSLILLGR